MKAKIILYFMILLVAIRYASAQVSVSLAPIPMQQFFDSNGNPLVGGELFTYSSGTTTPLATYTDSSGTTQNANPIILDSAGRASIWLPPSSVYRFRLQDSSGNLIWQQDGITSVSLSNGGTMNGAFGGNPFFSGSPSVSGNGTAGQVPLPVLASRVFNPKAYGAVGDGVTNDATALQAALTAAGASGGTFEVPSGSFMTLSTLTVPSNVRIHCEAGALIEAADTLDPLLDINGASNVEIQNCIINGGLDAIKIEGASSHVKVRNNEIRNFGAATTDVLDPGIFINAIGSSISDIRILDNRIHDGVMGIFAQSNASGYTISHLLIRGNEIYANAKDGVSFYGTSSSVGIISGAAVQNNLVYCNGWPANGTGFPSSCTPGRLQAGAAASVGVAYNFNNVAMPNLVVTGNVSHDNPTDGGFDFTPRSISTVNTSGTGVTWVSGGTFDTKWPVNQAVSINGTTYHLASVASSTSLTLTTSAGTQSSVTMDSPRELDAVVSGNASYRDNIGFFYQYAIGIASSGNVASGESTTGFSTESSSEIVFNGDISNSNYTVSTSCSGAAFCMSDGLNESLLGVQARNDSATGAQTGLAFLNTDVTPFVLSQSEQSTVNDNTATNPLTIVNGLVSSASKVCFAGSGTGCISGSPAGSFTSSLPAESGVLAASSGTGVISAGSATLATGTATVTFAHAYGAAPACTATDTTATNAVRVSAVTATGFTLTGTGSDVIDWTCVPVN